MLCMYWLPCDVVARSIPGLRSTGQRLTQRNLWRVAMTDFTQRARSNCQNWRRASTQIVRGTPGASCAPLVIARAVPGSFGIQRGRVHGPSDLRAAAGVLGGRRRGTSMNFGPDVAIVGAGPNSVSIAAHLRSTDVTFRIFGRPHADLARAHAERNAFQGRRLRLEIWRIQCRRSRSSPW
jgi:hypothetical protein